MILFRRMYRWKKIVLGNFHSSCRIEFPIYSISRIASGSHKVLPLSSSRFQQERAVPSNLVRFFENSRTVTDSSLSNDFSRIHFQIHPCVRETERESARTQNFWPYTSPLHSSRSRRWRYHYSVAVISVACGGTTLAREIKTSGFYVAWDDGSWPVYWSWPPLRAGTRRGALAPRPAPARLRSPPRNASKAIEDRVDRICQSSCYLFLLFLLFCRLSCRLLFRVNLSFLLTGLVICLVISSIY